MKLLLMLKSRKLWAAVIGLVLIIAQQYNHAFDAEQVTGMVVVIAAYIIGVALDPGDPAKNKLVMMFASKKFWAAVIGLVVLSANQLGLPLPIGQDAMLEISGLFGTLVIAMGYVDRDKLLEMEAEIEEEVSEGE